MPRTSRAYIRWAIEGSLARLRTDVIDIYMLHKPDGVTPLAETVEALGELVQEGKARYAGLSNVESTRSTRRPRLRRRTGCRSSASRAATA